MYKYKFICPPPEVLSKEELKETKQFKRESDKLWMRTGRKYV